MKYLSIIFALVLSSFGAATNPPVSSAAVMVDTNGLLKAPLNFFRTNTGPIGHFTNGKTRIVELDHSWGAGTGASTSASNTFNRIQIYNNESNWTYTNVSVAGSVISDWVSSYTAYVHPLAPASGTNGILILGHPINDAIAGSSAVTMINAYSNLVKTAQSDGWKVLGQTIPSSLSTALRTNDFQRAQFNRRLKDSSFLNWGFDSAAFHLPATADTNLVAEWIYDGLHLNDLGHDFDGYGKDQALRRYEGAWYPTTEARAPRGYGKGVDVTGNASDVRPDFTVGSSGDGIGQFLGAANVLHFALNNRGYYGMTTSEFYPLSGGARNNGRYGQPWLYGFFGDDSVGATAPTNGIAILNQTVATVGAQKYSPAFVFRGQGWKTDATAASQPVEFRSYLQPVQGAAAPTGNLITDSRINGGSWANSMTFGTDGTLSVPALLVNGSTVTGGVGGIQSAYSAGTVYSLTDTAALLDFGTTDPTITVSTTGTYVIFWGTYLKLNGASFASDRTVTIKIRRTNNTAADISNATLTVDTGVTSVITGTLAVVAGKPVSYAATAGDILQVWGSVSVAPSLGSLDANDAWILIQRIQ